MKSQVSIEFLVGVLILLLIYTVTLSVYNLYFSVPVVQTERGKQVCYLLSENIDSAVIGGDGFATNVSMPPKIDSSEYVVMITITNSSLVTVDWDKGLFACSITTQSVPNMTFKSGRISIINLNEDIVLGTVWTEKVQYALGETVNISGSYYLGDVSLKIAFENGTIVYSNSITPAYNSFDDSWTPTSPGRYIISSQDSLYKNLNSERYVEIV